MIESAKGKTDSQVKFEWCVEDLMKDGLSREAAILECTKMQKSDSTKPVQRKYKTDVETKDDSLGITDREATPLERCIGCRMDVYGEDEATARMNCQKMFGEPLIKHKTGLLAETIFSSGDATKIGDALTVWDQKFSMEPFYVALRENRELHRKYIKTFGVDSWKAKDRHGLNYDIEQRMQQIRYRKGVGVEKFIPFEAWKIAHEEIHGEFKKRMNTMHNQNRLTVGDTHGKTTNQILKEQAQTGSRKRLTVGSLYGKTRKQILEEQKESEQT
jgi:hypothetical protein